MGCGLSDIPDALFFLVGFSITLFSFGVGLKVHAAMRKVK